MHWCYNGPRAQAVADVEACEGEGGNSVMGWHHSDVLGWASWELMWSLLYSQPSNKHDDDWRYGMASSCRVCSQWLSRWSGHPTQPTSILLQLQPAGRREWEWESLAPHSRNPRPSIPIAIPSRTPGVGSGWSAALAVQFLPAAASPPLFAAHATDASKQASSSSALRSAVEWSEAKLQLACTRGSPPCSGGHLYSESFCPDWTPPTGKAMAMAWSVRQVRITCNNRLSTRYIYLA